VSYENGRPFATILWGAVLLCYREPCASVNRDVSIAFFDTFVYLMKKRYTI
jgi:hypothetical protein